MASLMANRGGAVARVLVLLLEAAPALAFSPLVRHNERRWAPARPTETAAAMTPALDFGGISPVPTEAARLPELAGMELVRRQFTIGTDTCGFAAEYKSEAYTCFRVSATCLTSGSIGGCCVGSAPDCYSTFLTTCQDFQTSATCGPQNLCCPSSAPSCFTWLSSTTVGASTISLFNCYTTGGSGTLLATPPGVPSQQTTSRSSSSSSSSRTSNTPDPDTTSTGPPAQTTTPPPAASSSDSSTNLGAIVGGAVGGVAVLGIAVLVIVWMAIRNRRAKADAAAAGTTPNAALPPPGPVTGFPPGSGGSPAQMTVAPSSTMASPQMSQTGGYFPGPTPPPPHNPMMAQQQTYGTGPPAAVAPGAPMYGGYYEPPKPQLNPVYANDPRYSAMQQQHTGASPSESGWSAGTSPHHYSQQPPPSELGGVNPVGTRTNPAQMA